MPRLPRTLRFALPLLVLVAAFVFTAALATATLGPGTSLARQAVASRDIIQPLRFTNPFLLAGTSGQTDFGFPNGGDQGGADSDPSGFDLGDAVEGQPITRLLTARGGYLPYTFIYEPLLGSGLASEQKNAPTLPPLDPNGLIRGDVDTGLGRYLRFNSVLGDFLGSGRVGTFRLFVFNSVTAPNFRFAIDRLPTGALGHSYITTLDVLNKPAGTSLEYTFVPGSLLVNGTQGASTLEGIGLTVGRDGRIFGRPTTAGTVTFKVKARAVTYDNAGLASEVGLALTRNGLAGDQTVAMLIEPTYPLVTEMTAQSFSIKGGNAASDGQESYDSSSVSYSGVVDTRGFTGPRLAGSEVIFRVGGGAFTGTLDDRGNAKLVDPIQSKTKGTLKLSTGTGRLSVRLTDALMARYLNLGGVAGSDDKTVALALEIKGFRTTEVLVTKYRGTGSKFSMGYGIGSRGFSPTGAFQILKIDGNPGFLDGERATKWQVRYIGMPGSTSATGARDSVAGLTTITVLIGNSFSQEVTLEDKNTVRPANSPRVFKAKRTDAGLRTVLFDPNRFVHFIQTNALSPAETGIPAAIDTKDLTLFPLSITISGQAGETGRIIVPNRDKWTQR